MFDFSIVIPIYNEKDSIGKTIEHLKELIDHWGLKPEVLLVNDGSDDGTEEILARVDERCFKVHNHTKNKGYGAALKTGIIKATTETIVITDADETYPNERIEEFVKRFRENSLDMLVGARVGDNVQIPLIRKPAKKALNMLANYLTRYKIPDINSGLRVMKKDTVKKFFNILPNGFSFTTTITLAMLTNNHDVEYVKIDYFDRGGKSKIKPIRDTLNFTQLIIRTVTYFDPLRVFVPISLLFLVVGIGFLGYRAFFGGEFLATTIIVFLASLQFLSVGMIADLIDKRMGRD